MGLQIIRQLHHSIVHTLSASKVEKLGQQIAVGRGELKVGEPLCTLPQAVANERRAQARLVMGPVDGYHAEAERRMVEVLSQFLFGCPFANVTNTEFKDEFVAEARLMHETVLDVYAGAPVVSFMPKGRIF